MGRDNILIVFFVIILSILAYGCSKEEILKPDIGKVARRACDSESDREKLSTFVIKCAEAANPKSDEEGEDLVEQCEITGTNVVCPVLEYCYDKNIKYDHPKPCSFFNK